MKIKLTLNKIRRTALFTILLLVSGFIGYRIGIHKVTSYLPNTRVDLSLFWYVWNRLEEKYLIKDDVEPEKMVEGAISGMVSALGDPYTVFLPPEDNKINKEDLTGHFGGVGIQLGYKNDILAVVSPLKGTPAEKAGVKSGDLILKIKDEEAGIDQSTDGISLPEAVRIIRGREGSEVKLTLMRDGQDKAFEVSIKRGTINIPSIESRWEERGGKKIAYIHMLQFSEQMNRDWLKWVEEISKEQNYADFGGVVLDLRNNPGGYLQGAVFAAGEFLPRGKVVVWQEDYQGQKHKFVVDREGSLVSVPLVVLVNGGSASAAEILAGALKDYGRAKIVGTKTFGKGTVQEPEELPGNAGLHVTIARWLLPNGDNIHKEGIEPDIEVDLGDVDGDKDLILEKGLDILIGQ